MIDEKKLLCAFIYSAYDSGYCGLMLDEKTRLKHMRLYKSYIKTGEYFPQKEINETQKEMMGFVNGIGIRGYIYKEHLKVVVKRIENESKQDFDKAIKSSDYMLYPAIRCPVHFYQVIKLNKGSIGGRDLFLQTTRKLVVLEGLEKPNLGDLVSGHWDNFLEIINDLEDLKEYKQVFQEHISRIRKK